MPEGINPLVNKKLFTDINTEGDNELPNIRHNVVTDKTFAEEQQPVKFAPHVLQSEKIANENAQKRFDSGERLGPDDEYAIYKQDNS